MVRLLPVRTACLVFIVLAALPAAAAAQSDTLFERASQSRMKGPPAAPVLVYEIADFQCPYCAEFAREVYPRIDSAYIRTGRVQWVFVHLPMPSHAHAWSASEAALCAGAVGSSFWQMHERIFSEQDVWTAASDPSALFAGYARELGVPMESYSSCVRDDRVSSLILADVIFAASTRVSGTPMFIINNERSIVGLKSFEEWKEMLERELKKK